MDMTTLKSIILELREKGSTFQEIADELESKYGVKKTRQAISGLYKRSLMAGQNKASKQIVVTDVVNIYSLTDNATQAHTELQQLGVDISYRQLLDIVKEEKVYIERVKRTIIAGIETRIDGLRDIRDAMNSIEYKGVRVSKKRFDEYFKIAYYLHIRQGILEEITKLYKLTASKETAKEVGEKFRLAIRTDDLRDKQ